MRERGVSERGAAAYVLAPAGSVRGRRILLIDDVLTTGSTASQCARALRAGGAAWVGVLTYARAGDGDIEQTVPEGE